MGQCALVIHGGVFAFSGILDNNMTPAKEALYKEKLEETLRAGYGVLKNGGSALEAVEVAVRIMEDSPLFNAGRGSAFTSEGKNEMDAAIMDGKTRRAAAIAGVRNIKNPVSAARAVMEKSVHVMMVGQGAEQFAKQCGIEISDPSYFFDQDQWDVLQKAKKAEAEKEAASPGKSAPSFTKLGTVGAVALDLRGDIAAATSTGGTTNKRYGRVGDSPVIGGGTYADNETCAVSCTGHGEYFIRTVAGHDIAARMKYKGMSLAEAAQATMQEVEIMGGAGGVIGVDARGNIAMPFNTPGMYRGFVNADGKMTVLIYKD